MKRKVYLLPLILFFCTLFGCATVRPINESKGVITHVYNKNYELGVKKSSYVGEEIIKVEDYYLVKKEISKLQASDDFTISLTFAGTYHANKGDQFNILGMIDESEGPQYLVSFPGMNGIRFCINMDGTISNRMIGLMNQKLATNPDVVPSDVKLRVVSAENIDQNKGYINYEIVFTGITENNMTFLYREYSREGLAKVAFYQNITYPIIYRTLRFKKILISIESINSEQIDYVVLKDGL